MLLVLFKIFNFRIWKRYLLCLRSARTQQWSFLLIYHFHNESLSTQMHPIHLVNGGSQWLDLIWILIRSQYELLCTGLHAQSYLAIISIQTDRVYVLCVSPWTVFIVAVVVSQSEGCSGQDRLISNHESIQLQIHIQTHRQVISSNYKSVQYRQDTASILELYAGQTFTVIQTSGLKKN